MAHDILIIVVDLLLHVLCTAETFYSVTISLKLQNYKLNLVFTGYKPLSSDENSPDHS